jgi:hypothetical protein
VNTRSLNPIGLPSGNQKKYTINSLSRANDLNLLTPSKARFIAKHWENNILNSGLEIMDEDVHVLNKIDELMEIMARENNYIYISWSPSSVINEVLFIIVGETNAEKNEFVVKLIVQSPFWNPKQISSENLKYAIEELIYGMDNVYLNMSYLYDNDLRYKLSWLTINQI